MTLDTDILIVGAGLSGVVAAYRLLEQNPKLKVGIVEARDRVGGRILSVPTEYGAFDVGPTWFWPHHTHVRALAEELGVGVFRQYDTGLGVFEAGQGQAVRLFRPDPELTQPAFRLVGGVGSLVDALVDRLPAGAITLSQPVHKITADPDGLTVSTAENQYQAKHVCVTLPPRLTTNLIEFDPPLPSPVWQVMQNTQTWMGQAMKVVVVYDKPFWREKGLSGLGVSYVGPVQQFHDACPAGAEVGALFGWLGNESWGRRLSVEARKEAVVEQVGRMYGGFGRELLAYAECNWSTEPYTTHTPIPEHDHPEYDHPLLQQAQYANRLHWLTAEASPVNGGYLDGAIYLAQQIARHCLLYLS